jgi:hypothetical protein
MNDDRDKKCQDAKAIQEELNKKRLSRRGLLQRLKLLGVGFGAGYLLSGKGAEAAVSSGEESEAVANLKSTNPVLNEVIDESRKEGAAGEESADDDRNPRTRTTFRRVFRRVYRRI